MKRTDVGALSTTRVDPIPVAKVVLKGQLLGLTSPDRLTWTHLPEPLANYSVNGGICPGYDVHNGVYYAYIQPKGLPRQSRKPWVPVCLKPRCFAVRLTDADTGLPQVARGRNC